MVAESEKTEWASVIRCGQSIDSINPHSVKKERVAIIPDDILMYFLEKRM